MWNEAFRRFMYVLDVIVSLSILAIPFLIYFANDSDSRIMIALTFVGIYLGLIILNYIFNPLFSKKYDLIFFGFIKELFLSQ